VSRPLFIPRRPLIASMLLPGGPGNGCIDVRSSLLNVVLHDEPHINN
jgi:hypothetical protein